MKNTFEILEDLLRTDKRLSSQEGVLLKNKTQELALKNDTELIKLLLSKKEIKQHFFFEVEKTLIFDKEKFIQFVSNKQFLPDSYTAFKNKIGLTVDGEYLNKNQEVVLEWPYKDCVLEGGMSEEDQKRDEIFYNKTLAPDDITRLMDAKVFTNFKRIDKTAEHKLDKFHRNNKGIIKDNLIIKGNNLLALSSLKKEFTGQVKLIYIDPPYNRDAEAFYNDSFHRSSWLVFMKNRLEIAKQLLREDGFIFIQIDDAQQAYLKILCDEVFDENFINTVAVQMSTASGLKISHKDKKILKIKEYLLVYSKSKHNILFNPIYTPKKEWDDGYDFYLEKNNTESVKDWKVKKLGDVLSENDIYNKNINDPIFKKFYLKNKELIWGRGRHHNIPKETFALSMRHRDNVFEYGNKDEKNYAYRGRRLAFLSKTVNNCLCEDGSYKEDISVLLCDLWADINTAKLFNEGGVKFPNGKKPEQLLQRVIYLCTKENDIVLDFFLGSGGTAAVSHKINRQYIGIEQLNYEENDSVKRLKNVIKNEDAGGITKGVSWKGGGEFVYMELAKWNEEIIEKINKAKTVKELMKTWDKMKKSSFLSYKIDSKTIDTNAEDFSSLSIINQKKFLIECLDKNQLYVNLNDIEDKEYKIGNEDKKLNKDFYQTK